jgi:antitoxin ParD1/3/4
VPATRDFVAVAPEVVAKLGIVRAFTAIVAASLFGLRSTSPTPMIGCPLPQEPSVATNVHLNPELERFTRECIDGGRYNNVSEVVRAALRLLQETEDRRREFRRMLDAAVEETDRDGSFSIESVLAEMDEVIASAKR